MSNRALTDLELITAIRNGSSDAFVTLYKRYSALIGRVAHQYEKSVSFMDTEDIKQEALRGIYNAVRKYQPDRGAFPAFVKRCVETAVLESIRPYSNDIEAVTLDGRGDIDDPTKPIELVDNETPFDEKFFIREDLKRRLLLLKDRLTEKEWSILQNHIRGYSYKEIASKLQTTPKAVDCALQRIRKKASTIL